MSSESAKTALGLDALSGPVVVFVPHELIAHRDRATTADQQHLLQVYDFFHYRNYGGGNPAATAVVPPAPAIVPAPPVTAVVPAPAAQAVPAPPAVAVGRSPALFPVRAFLPGASIPPPGLGAYGMVALKAKPTPSTAARLQMLCQAFLASLPPQSSLPASVPLSAQMVTFWPTEAGPDPASCPELLSRYDLWAGLSAIHDATAQGNDLSGRGPFLIGWSPSESRLRPDAVVLVIDMSRFEEQASFDDAFLFWQHKVVEDPALWRSGFSAERLRLSMRDFVDHYGSDILKAVHLGGS